MASRLDSGSLCLQGLSRLACQGFCHFTWKHNPNFCADEPMTFPLSSEPFQGSYKVVVQKGSGGTAEHPFTVEEFGMPLRKITKQFFFSYLNF